MADKQPFSDKIDIKEGPTPKSGKKGIYYTIVSAAGKTYNLNEQTYQTFGALKPGQTIWADGNLLPPRAGYDHGSRWIDSYASEGAGVAQTAPPPQITKTSAPSASSAAPTGKYPGYMCGMGFKAGYDAALMKGLKPENRSEFFGYVTQQAKIFMEECKTFEHVHKEVDF